MTTKMVHLTQKHYRELVDLYSHPGEVRTTGINTPNYSTFSDATLATVLTLFDNEITFFAHEKINIEEFQTLTGGKYVDYQDADFVVVKSEDLTEEILNTMKVGKLASPEKSSTLIIEVESIGAGQKYLLQGPGIETSMKVAMGLNNEWMELRNVRCKEFPIGIDLIIIDTENQMTVIPRTTMVEVN